MFEPYNQQQKTKVMENVTVYSNYQNKIVEIRMQKLRDQARSMGCYDWRTASFNELDDFFRDNSGKIHRIYRDECEVYQSGRFQSVTYGDFQSSGEITDWSRDGWFCHTEIIDYDEEGVLIVELYDFNPGFDNLDVNVIPLTTGFVDE